MQEEDPADFDGDGQFDAVDLEIIEDGNFKASRKSSCGIVLFLPFLFSILVAIFGIL